MWSPSLHRQAGACSRRTNRTTTTPGPRPRKKTPVSDWVELTDKEEVKDSILTLEGIEKKGNLENIRITMILTLVIPSKAILKTQGHIDIDIRGVEL